jgi:hypothetical protein
VTGDAAADDKGKSFKDHAGTAAAAVAVAGAVWYGAVLLVSAWVYEPVGVSPRDLGLSSSATLVQATVGLLVVVGLSVAVGAFAGGLWGVLQAANDQEQRQIVEQMPLPFWVDDPVSNAAAAAELQNKLGLSQEEAEQFVRAAHDTALAEGIATVRPFAPADMTDEKLAEFVSAIQRELPRKQVRDADAAISGVLVGGVGAALVALVCLLAVVLVAHNSRQAIQSGRASGFVLGLPAPWSGTVADVHPAGNAPAQGAPDALPACALFLGQNDSTVFLRDGSARTIRVPASTVRLDLRDRDGCP